MSKACKVRGVHFVAGPRSAGQLLPKHWGSARLACSAAFIVVALLSEPEMRSAVPHRAATLEGETTQSAAAAETDLQRGIDLTKQGFFEKAIPFLVRARGENPGDYAAGFNLALCYLGISEFKQAIGILNELQRSGHNTAAVNNLLSQAYVGSGQLELAFNALQEASRQTPKDEKLYAFVADACTDHYAYGFGLRVVELGLQQLPDSARLHYERAVFLARLDRLEEAIPEFQFASKLAPGSDIAYLALIQENLYEDKFPEALSLIRKEIQSGHRDYQMLALQGTVLMQSGVMPGQPGFVEAREALEASVVANSGFSMSQIALGKLYLMEGRARDAVAHLEVGRRLEPRNPAVYTALARAYRQLGEPGKAQESLDTLAGLLREKTATASAPHPYEEKTP
jgi:tetratricopeptide (TPR) repeat protein